jgi:putative transposase
MARQRRAEWRKRNKSGWYKDKVAAGQWAAKPEQAKPVDPADQLRTVMKAEFKAQQNGYVESFNGRLRDECLNETLFASLSHARSVLRIWRDDYNHVRPHSGIGGLTPADAAMRVAQPHPSGHPGNPGLYL